MLEFRSSDFCNSRTSLCGQRSWGRREGMKIWKCRKEQWDLLWIINKDDLTNYPSCLTAEIERSRSYGCFFRIENTCFEWPTDACRKRLPWCRWSSWKKVVQTSRKSPLILLDLFWKATFWSKERTLTFRFQNDFKWCISSGLIWYLIAFRFFFLMKNFPYAFQCWEVGWIG